MKLLDQFDPELLFLASLRCKRLSQVALSPERLWPLVARHQMETWVYPNLSRLDSRGIHAQFRSECRSMAVRNFQLAMEMQRLLNRLGNSNTKPIPYKGPTLELLVHGHLGYRKIQDLDFFLPNEEIATARELLREDGYLEASPNLSSHQREILYTRLCELVLFRPEDDMLVELHSRVVPRAFHFPLRYCAVAPRLEPVAFGRLMIPTLGREDLVLVLCANHAKDGWTCLRWLYDLAGVLDASKHLDWHVLVARAQELRVVRLLMLGLYLTNQVLAYPLPDHVLQQCFADRALPVLAQEVVFRWTNSERGERDDYRRFWFQLKLREHLPDGLRYATARTFAPSLADLESVRLPDVCGVLYYFVHLFRLARNYATKMARKVGMLTIGDKPKQ